MPVPNLLGSATFRLTLWYLAIIMAISMLFSLLLYGMAARELELSYRRERVFYQLRQSLGPGFDNVTYVSPDELYDRALGHLRINIVIINASILLLAGAASYLLARRTLRPIEAALLAQGRFAADASHELRTPLTAMKAEIEVALRGSHLDIDEARDLLKSNLEEIGKLEALSTGLLKLAQSDGHVPPGVPVKLAAATKLAFARTRTEASVRGITLEDHSDEARVTATMESVVEVMVILLDNAIKYSPPGSLVTLSSSTHGQTVSFAVIDQGNGIAPADLPRVFDRFFRADDSRSKQAAGGYGLGLSIAKKQVESYGGAISVTSQTGQGSRFMVELPAA